MSGSRPALPQQIRTPIQQFIEGEQASGFLLLFVTALAMGLANFGLGDALHHLWELPVSLQLGSISVNETLHFWINDVLMAVFFLQVGLEIKRELTVGELSERRKAALPMFAALGGMLMPGLLYTLFNLGSEGRLQGWAIPTATDIAFSLGILALLGNRVPDGVKVFLAALAIADDLGAIVIIGLFYSSDLQTEYLALGFGIVGLMAALNYLGARRIIFYLVPGIVLWYAFWRAGIHPTLAGVITAFAIPNNFNLSREALGDYCGHRVQDLAQGLQNNSLSRREFTEEIENLFARVATPAQKLEFNLGWVVPFLIMPLFAFANTGIVLTPASVQGLFSPVGIGIVVGLFIGKPLGIYLLSLLVIRIGWGRLPDGVTKAHLLGAGMLAGIGFTMSIFVSGLAFTEYELKEAAKLGILLGSILSGVLGLYFLSRTARKGGNW